MPRQATAQAGGNLRPLCENLLNLREIARLWHPFAEFFEKKLGEGLIFWGILFNFVVGLVMEAKSILHYRRFLYEYSQFGVNRRHL